MEAAFAIKTGSLVMLEVDALIQCVGISGDHFEWTKTHGIPIQGNFTGCNYDSPFKVKEWHQISDPGNDQALYSLLAKGPAVVAINATPL